MYNEFYGFKESPFSISPDPDFMYWSQKHLAAFRHLMYNIHRKSGIILLTGEIGTGKTTIINALLREINDKAKVAKILSSVHDVDELYQHIFYEFGLRIHERSRIDYIIKLKEFLMKCYDENNDAILILDEAQNFSDDVLEEIRLLSNIETPKEKLIQIILVGQTLLLEKINRIGFEQVKQRIGMSYHLQPLSKAETDLYIRRRLEIAGSTKTSLFQDDAIEEVFSCSKGIPRVINTICDNALLFGAAEHYDQIEAKVIRRVVENLTLAKAAGQRGASAALQEELLKDNSPEDTAGNIRGTSPAPPYISMPYVQSQPDEERRWSVGSYGRGTRQRITLFITAAILISIGLSGFMLARLEGLKQTLAAFPQLLTSSTPDKAASSQSSAPVANKGIEGRFEPRPLEPAKPAVQPPAAQEPPPRFLYKPEPEYPPIARRLGLEGIVTLNMELRADGTVGEVNLVESSNYPILDEAAQRTVKKWTHAPTRRDGVPITRWITHRIAFQLSDGGPGQYGSVRQIQDRLRAAGFDPGPPDGVVGPRTREALRKYQESRGLAVTGELDDATRQALQGN